MLRTALIVYFRDRSFLLNVLSTLSWVDEIVVVDGPYTYTRSALGFVELSSDVTEEEIAAHVPEGVRLKYHCAVWDDELEKRTKGYELCQDGLVFLVDADEFIDIKIDAIEAFERSDKSVAAMLCQNLYADGYLGASRGISSLNDLPWKFFAFKKPSVASRMHIDYLWLVGVHQNARDESQVYRNPLAVCYHFTGMRDRRGIETKTMFYTSLFHHTRDSKNPLASQLEQMVADGSMSSDNAVGLYADSTTSSFGIGERINIYPHVQGSEWLEAWYRRFVSNARRPLEGEEIIECVSGFRRYVRIKFGAKVTRLHAMDEDVRIDLDSDVWPVAGDKTAFTVARGIALASDEAIELPLTTPVVEGSSKEGVQLLAITVRRAGQSANRGPVRLSVMTK